MSILYIFGHQIIENLNSWIESNDGFGGFMQAVPGIIPSNTAIGSRPVDRVAEQDLILRHILMKRERHEDYIQHRVEED